jgi:hypothetical protein
MPVPSARLSSRVPQQAQLFFVQDITPAFGPIPDDGDDTWEDVDDSVVPSQPNRFRSKKK